MRRNERDKDLGVLYGTQLSTRAALVHALERYMTKYGADSATVAVLAVSEDPISAVESRCRTSRDLSLTKVWSAGAVACFRLKTGYLDHGRKTTVDGSFWIVREDTNTALVLTLSGSMFWQKGLDRFLNRFRYAFARMHARTTFLLDLAVALERQPAVHEAMVSRATYRERTGSDESLRYRTTQNWERDSVPPELFRREALSSEITVKVLKLSFVASLEGPRGPYSRRCQLTVHRNSTFVSKGCLEPVFDTVIARVMQSVQAAVALFSARARELGSDRTPKPLEICYEVPIFRKKDSLAKLVSALRSLEHATCSALFYEERLIASLVDYTDGSAYQIVCCSDDRIMLIPQYRATRQSLDRLCEHILMTFREGSVASFAAGTEVGDESR